MTNDPELDPADIWYALITLYGEVTMEVDIESFESFPNDRDINIKKNRRAWNGWACRNIDDPMRRNVEKIINLDEGELNDWNAEEIIEIQGKMLEFLAAGRHVKEYKLLQKVGINRFLDEKLRGVFQVDDKIEHTGYTIDLENKDFYGMIYANKFVFDMCDFDESTFHQQVYFIDCFFTYYGHFDRTTFKSSSCFSGTVFSRYGEADFRHAKFEGEAMFSCTNFKGGVDFSDANFHSPAIFRDTKFGDHIKFNRTKFEEKTNFNNAIFKKRVPKFYDAIIHKDTKFTLRAKDYWPHPRKDAEGGKNAYTNLIQLMRGQQKPDDEHFFYRQEMAWKAQHEGWLSWLVTRPYGWFSGYGHSLWQPLAWFTGILLSPAIVVWLVDLFHNGWLEKQGIMPEGESGWRVLGVSAANMFPFLRFERQYVFGVLEKEPWGWLLVGGLQSLLAIAFLFLFALALRNRFRLGA